MRHRSERRARRGGGLVAAGLAALALCASASGCAGSGAAGARPSQGLRYSGPGELLVIFEYAGDRRELVLVQSGGARKVEMPPFREARFVGPDRLVLALEAPKKPDDYGPPPTQLALHDLLSGSTRRFGPVGGYYDLEPSPDGLYLAVGDERDQVGDADFEIWSLGDEPERLARRKQALEEPRWRDAGDKRSSALAVGILIQDPEGHGDTGGSFGGTDFGWPRLHKLRRDLGKPELIYDGSEPGQLAPGGSLPLWWDLRGLFARQREGLMRCDVERGTCTRVYAAEPGRRVVDGRPVGAREAWLLTLEASDALDRREPDEIVRVDLETGKELSRWHAPPGVAVIDIDWQAP